MPLSVTQFGVDRNSTATNGDARDDGDDVTDGRAAKRRKIQVSFSSSILEKLSRPDGSSEENLIPWIQIVRRMLEKFPAIFLQRWVKKKFPVMSELGSDCSTAVDHTARV